MWLPDLSSSEGSLLELKAASQLKVSLSFRAKRSWNSQFPQGQVELFYVNAMGR